MGIITMEIKKICIINCKEISISPHSVFELQPFIFKIDIYFEYMLWDKH